MAILTARALHKAYGAKVLLDAGSLSVQETDRIGLIGINGAGKSTLLRMLAGVETPDAGTVERKRDARVLYLEQEPVLPADATARAIVLQGLDAWSRVKRRLDELTHALSHGREDDGPSAEWATELAHLHEELERLGGWEMDHKADEMLRALGMDDGDRNVGTMSGGERRRVALARLLVARPDVAIVDEPTNHLDAWTIETLEELFRSELPGALVFVTHDRYLLDALATRIVELDRGTLTEYAGNYAAYIERKAERIAHESRAEANRQNFIRRERAWLERGAKARTTKQKARIQRAEAVIAGPAPKAHAEARLAGAQTQNLGGTIVAIENAVLAVEGRRLTEPFTLHLVAGDRVGVVGPNGAGKTTLLRAIVGESALLSGELRIGAKTRIAYFDQARAQLEPTWSVFDNVAGRQGAERNGGGVVDLPSGPTDLHTYLEGFLFDGHAQRQPVGSLSGGERARVALAKLLREGANVLLLDEPTNDLDMATLGALEEMVGAWRGVVVVVSHDRSFLDAVATRILSFEAVGEALFRPTVYAGNYTDFRAQSAAGLRPVGASARAAAAASLARPTAGLTARSGGTSTGASTGTLLGSPSGAAGATGACKPLTHAERKELEGIFVSIEAAETEVAELEATLADGSIYARADAATYVKATQTALEAARARASSLTSRWEELEARKGEPSKR